MIGIGWPVTAQTVSKRGIWYNTPQYIEGSERMKRFIKGECRTQTTLLPESIDEFITDANPVRLVDVFFAPHCHHQ